MTLTWLGDLPRKSEKKALKNLSPIFILKESPKDFNFKLTASEIMP
jgi:hypothetical protein